MITQSAKLNLIPGAVLQRINVSQYDKGSRTLEFPIYDGEQRFTLTSSMSASIHGTKPDGNGFAYAGTVNTTDNIVEIDVVQQMTAVSGEVVCEVIITKSGNRIGTVNFILNVQPAALKDGTVISDSDLSIVEEALEFAEDIPGYRNEFEGYVEDAEAWAKGTRNGIAVPSTDPTFHNNSKYYAARYTELTSAINTMTNDLGAKNLLVPTLSGGDLGANVSQQSFTNRNVTYTIDKDGVVTADGKATGGISIAYIGNNDGKRTHLPVGEYKVTGLSGGSSSTYQVNLYKNGNNEGAYTDPFTFTVTSEDDGYGLRLRISENYTVSNQQFKFMIKPVSITEDTFVPYAKTNQQLTEETTALLDNTEVNGAVNMLPNLRESVVDSGITYTVNADGSVTCNGTATANNHLDIVKTADNYFLPKGTYKLTGCPSGGTDNTYYIRLYNVTSGSAVQIGREYGDGLAFNLTESAKIAAQIQFISGATANNLTFKPMIAVASYDGDYVPYAKSNKELTADVATANTELAKRGYCERLTHKQLITITHTGSTRCIVKIVTPQGEIIVQHSGTAWGTPTSKVVMNRDSSIPTWTYAISGEVLTINSSVKLDGFLYYSYDNITIEQTETGTAQANTIDSINLYTDVPQGVSAYGGTLAVSHTGVTANVATQIISKRGVYLVLFTFYDVASAVYLINVDSSDSSKCFATELAAPPSGVTITFDFSTAGKVKATTDHGYRARVITIADANY